MTILHVSISIIFNLNKKKNQILLHKIHVWYTRMMVTNLFPFGLLIFQDVTELHQSCLFCLSFLKVNFAYKSQTSCLFSPPSSKKTKKPTIQTVHKVKCFLRQVIRVMSRFLCHMWFLQLTIPVLKLAFNL